MLEFKFGSNPQPPPNDFSGLQQSRTSCKTEGSDSKFDIGLPR